MYLYPQWFPRCVYLLIPSLLLSMHFKIFKKKKNVLFTFTSGIMTTYWMTQIKHTLDTRVPPPHHSLYRYGNNRMLLF